jgi:hypothetical protein
MWEDNIKIHFKDMCVRMWTGFMWHRIGFSGRIL